MSDNSTPAILARDDGTAIAYHRHVGNERFPGVVFLPGFMSDMTGTKATTLEAWCRRREVNFLRFDYRGHGQSSGKFEQGTIGRWTDDAVFAIENLTAGRQILVGSSMGGWIMLLAALRLKERVAALIGIAAAPDFTEDLIRRELTDQQRAHLNRHGSIAVPTDYGDQPYVITKELIDDGRANLLLGQPIPLDIPVRLIHGMRDDDVPWRTALRIQQQLRSDDVEVTLVKNGGHRLSQPHDLKRLTGTLDRLIVQLSS